MQNQTLSQQLKTQKSLNRDQISEDAAEDDDDAEMVDSDDDAGGRKMEIKAGEANHLLKLNKNEALPTSQSAISL